MNAARPSKAPVDTPKRPAGAETQLAERLRCIRVGLRGDLEVSRHVFRGQPAYVVRDPMTFESHRLAPREYGVFTAIHSDRALGDIFEDLVSQQHLEESDQEEFYRFVFTLHRLGFLQLPVSDEKVLYQRHQARARAKRRQTILGVLYLRVPLVNPDAFLRRTLRLARPVFSHTALALWAVWMVAAAFAAVGHADRLVTPLEGVLAARNLPLMWITLVVLKVFHELGHAYACRLYGGHVPEMGAYLILFTPCAYVDATASWGFSRKRERIIVCLAGMYVESFLAAGAVLLWAATDHGLVHDLAYNVIFLAGVMTILFNINPLMRYDGYYLLSDLLEIPNLRQRSAQYVATVLKRVALGIRTASSRGNLRLRAVLLSYGLAVTLYRATLMVTIAAVIARKVIVVGWVAAVLFLGSLLVQTTVRTFRYLWYGGETAPVRARAVAVSAVLLLGIPMVLALWPLRTSVPANGVISRENELMIRAHVDGLLETATARPGQSVQAGDVVAQMTNLAFLEAVAKAQAEVTASQIRCRAYEVRDSVSASQEKQLLAVHQKRLGRAEQDLADLTVRATTAGEVLNCVQEKDVGRFLREGEPIAMLGHGGWIVETLLTQDDLADVRPEVGDAVEVRLATAPHGAIRGTISRVVPAGCHVIDLPALTHVGGGSIPVLPSTPVSAQAYFKVTVHLPDVAGHVLRSGGTGRVRFQGRRDPIGLVLFRHLLRFNSSLRQS